MTTSSKPHTQIVIAMFAALTCTFVASNAFAQETVPTIQVNSPEPMSLETRDTPNRTWRSVCTTPCNTRLPTAAEYRLTGEGFKSSRPFRIDSQQRDEIQLRVDPASKAAFGGGVALVVLGALTAVVGSTVAIWNNGSYSYEGSKDWNTTRLLAGTGVSVVGIGMTIGGIVMLAKNGSSKVYDGDQRLGIRKPKREAERRAPTAQESATPAMWAVPILQGSF